MDTAAVAAKSIGSALSRILACTDQAAVDMEILRPVADLIAATSGVYCRFVAAPRQRYHASANIYSGVTPEASQAYLDQFYALDPLIQSGLAWLRDTRAPLEQIIALSADAIDACHPAYRDAFLRRYNVGHVIGLLVPCAIASGPQLICVGFHRRSEDQAFLRHELEAFARLVPAMSTVFRLLAYQETERLSRDLLDELSLCGGLGFVILDHDLAIENASARGLADLGIVAQDGSAGACGLLGEIRQMLIDDAAAGKLAPRRAVSAGRAAGSGAGHRPLDISMRRLSGPGGRDRYLLITSEPQTGRLLASAASAHDLTDRETEIARLVAAGLCNATLADELGISPRTVENHLRSIYAKVGVYSRTQLVAKLLRLR